MRTRLPLAICLLVLTAARTAPAPDGWADPGWDGARCGLLTIAAERQAGNPGDRQVQDFAASLSALGEPDIKVSHLGAAQVRTHGPASLDMLAPLFAGGLLVALERNRPHGCDLMHAFRRSAEQAASLPEGAQAEERWRGLRVETGNDVYQAATLRLHAENDAGGLTRVVEEASGLSSAGNDRDAAPIEHASIRVAIPHDRLVSLAEGHTLTADDVVHVERMELSSADTHVQASGEVRPAARSGHMLVRAANMEGIKSALPAGDRDRAGAAFLIMRLAAKEEADGTLVWDVAWDDGHVTINGVALPMRF